MRVDREGFMDGKLWMGKAELGRDKRVWQKTLEPRQCLAMLEEVEKIMVLASWIVYWLGSHWLVLELQGEMHWEHGEDSLNIFSIVY